MLPAAPAAAPMLIRSALLEHCASGAGPTEPPPAPEPAGPDGAGAAVVGDGAGAGPWRAGRDDAAREVGAAGVVDGTTDGAGCALPLTGSRPGCGRLSACGCLAGPLLQAAVTKQAASAAAAGPAHPANLASPVPGSPVRASPVPA